MYSSDRVGGFIRSSLLRTSGTSCPHVAWSLQTATCDWCTPLHKVLTEPSQHASGLALGALARDEQRRRLHLALKGLDVEPEGTGQPFRAVPCSYKNRTTFFFTGVAMTVRLLWMALRYQCHSYRYSTSVSDARRTDIATAILLTERLILGVEGRE